MTQRNDAFGLTYKPQLPPRHDYGIGIIGCGGIMNYAHLPAYRAHQLNIIGCYDVNPAAMHETAQRHAIATTYLDIAALLADPRIEIVDIAVPACGGGSSSRAACGGESTNALECWDCRQQRFDCARLHR